MELPGSSCLVIIDMQDDFVGDNGHYTKVGADISPMLEARRCIEETLKRFHSRIPVVYIRAEYPYEKFGKGKSICVPGTKGAELVIDTKYATEIITKDEYSALTSPRLMEFIRENKIRTLLIAGVTTECCVRSTALEALKKGFDVIVLEDCVATDVKAMHRGSDALKDIQASGGKIIKCGELG